MIRRALGSLASLGIALAIGGAALRARPSFTAALDALPDSLALALPAGAIGFALARSRLARLSLAIPALSSLALLALLLWPPARVSDSTPLAIAALAIAVAPLIARGQLGLAVAALPAIELALGREGLGQVAGRAARSGDHATLLGAFCLLLALAWLADLAASRLGRAGGAATLAPHALPLRIAVGVAAAGLLVASLGPTLAGSASLVLESPIPFERMQPPSSLHWLGTDQLGRDLLARLCDATRSSLLLGGAAAVLGSLVATASTLAASAFGSAGLRVHGRLERAVLLLPLIPLVTGSVSVANGSPSLGTAMLLAVLAWAIAAGRIRPCAERTLAAATVWRTRSLGGSALEIARRHVLPAVVPPAIAGGFAALGAALIAESSLALVTGDRSTLGGVLADAVGAGALPAGNWWYGGVAGAWAAALATSVLVLARAERLA